MIKILAGDDIYATDDANLLSAALNGGAKIIGTASTGELIGRATGKTKLNKGTTFVEILPGDYNVLVYVDIDTIRAVTPVIYGKTVNRGDYIYAIGDVNVLDGPYNGGAKTLYTASTGDLLGVASVNVFTDKGSTFVQFTEIGDAAGSELGRISYADFDSVEARAPTSDDWTNTETGERNVTKTEADGTVVTTTTSPDDKVTITKVDPTTGKVTTGTGTLTNPPAVDSPSVSKWLTYGLYAVIGLALIGIVVIMVRLFTKPKLAVKPTKK